MGRGWQDRRGESKSVRFEGPSGEPPASPLPSPPGGAIEGEAGPSGLAMLPEAKVQARNAINGGHQSRFPILDAILPFGRMTKPHGYGRAY